MLKPVAAAITTLGIRIVMYLDDFLVISSSKEQPKKDFGTVATLSITGIYYKLGEITWNPSTSY